MKRLTWVLTICLVLAATAVTSAASTQIVIQLMTGHAVDSWRNIIEEYDSLHPDVDVVLASVGRNGYFDRLQSQLIGGASVPDVVYFNNVQMATFASAGFIEPLDGYLADPSLTLKGFDWEDFVPGVRESATYKGKIYGFPWDISTYLLMYRKDLIEDPPKTWDEYLEVAKQFTQSLNPDSPTKYGTTQQGARGSLPPKEWSMRFWSYGGDYLNDAGEVEINSSAAVQALQDRVDLLHEWNVVPRDAINYSYPETNTALQQGLVAMGIQWNAAYPTLTNEEQSPLVADKIATTIVPGVKQPDGSVLHVPYIQNQFFAINAKSRHKEEAYRMLAWLNSKENHIAYALGEGGIPGTPGRISAFEDPRVREARPEFEVLAESLEVGRAFPAHSRWVQIHQAVDLAIARAASEQSSVRDALDQAAQTVESLN